MKPKEILLLGASGQIGRNLIRKFTINNFKIKAVTRNLHAKGYLLKTQGNPGYLEIEVANIFNEIEPVLYEIFEENKNYHTNENVTVSSYPFKKIPFEESLEFYGNDKPDLRNPLLIKDCTDIFKGSEFKISNSNYLLSYNSPGNVRELRNLIERIAILETGNDSEKILEIIKESLSKSSEEIFSITENLSVPLREARENFEKEYLTTQIKKFGGNISKTAKFVGMERSALHRKLKLLGVKDLN